MQRLECSATDCAYNHRCICSRDNVKMSAKIRGAKCNSYKPLPDYRMKLSSDMEIGSVGSDIACSAESCIFNIHYHCKAGKVSVSADNKSCKSYYGM